MFLIKVRESPSKDKFISPDELRFIKESLAVEKIDKTMKIPWKEIFTSIPCYAFIVAGLAEAWGFITLLTELPSFLQRKLFKIYRW